MDCKCGNEKYGFDCVCEHIAAHPGENEYCCEFCGLYKASEPRCNQCEAQPHGEVETEEIDPLTAVMREKLMNMFKPGDGVSHPKYGEVVLVEIDKDDPECCQVDLAVPCEDYGQRVCVQTVNLMKLDHVPVIPIYVEEEDTESVKIERYISHDFPGGDKLRHEPSFSINDVQDDRMPDEPTFMMTEPGMDVED